MKKVVAILLALTMVLSLAACAPKAVPAATEAPAPAVTAAPAAPAATEAPAKEEPIKIAYVCKMLTNPWFVAEDNGLKDAAKEFGFEYISIDANLDDEACDAAIDNAIAQGIKGLAMCITNQGNGPAVAQKCKDKGIALITLDDNIVDMEGKPIAHVGMPTKGVGVLGGEMLAKFANDRGFFKEGNVVKVLQIDAPDITVLKPRLDGYKESLLKNTPLKEEDFVYVETSECMLEDSLASVQPILQANPNVTHWICGAVNDDSAVALVKAIEEQGKIPLENILACGLGGYSMAVEEFKKGNTGFMTVVLNPYLEGYSAGKFLYEKIAKGTELPELTLINGNVATLENWKDLIKE